MAGRLVAFALLASILAILFAGGVCRAQARQDQNAMWQRLKQRLAGPDGEEYFKVIKHARLPRFRAAVISAVIRDGLTKLTVGVTDARTPEVTILFHTGDRRVKGSPKPGTMIEFEGVAMEFTKEPFMLTVDVTREHLEGLELERSQRGDGRPVAAWGPAEAGVTGSRCGRGCRAVWG
jgi:hypothetical protein